VTELDSPPAGETTPEVRRRRGRPRDPQLEERALEATLAVFGERGWVGLTIDEVAARALVGKSSIYLRWKDKETLLAAALRNIQRLPDTTADAALVPAEPTLRDYLIDHATRRANLYLGPHGLAMMRLYIETWAFPTVFADIRREALTAYVLEERQRVESAIRTGELPPHASAVQMLDAIEGAVLIHVIVTPPELLDRVRRNLPAYLEQLVENQLRAAAG